MKPVWKKIGIGAGILTGVLVVTLAGGIFYLQSHGLQKFASSKGSAVIGRTLAIDDLRLRWHWSEPRLVARNISLSNPEGAAEPNLFSADMVDIRFRVWPLLIGQLQLTEVNLDKPRLILEKTDEDTKNWDLPFMSKGKAAAETVVPEDRHDFPLVGSIVIQDGVLVYRDIPKKLDVELALDTAQGEGSDKSGLTISGEGTLQDKKFELTAKGGSIDNLRDTNKPYPLSVDLKMGPTVLKLDGTFKDPIKLTGIDASLSLQGDNAADLFYLTAIPLPPTPPYKLSGQLTKKEKVWGYENFTGKVGDSDLSGSVAYDTSGERGFARMNLASKLMDMKDLGGFIGLTPKNAARQAASDRALPDIPLNLERLRATDLDVTLKADEIRAPGIPVNRLNTHIVLKQGVLTFDPLNVGIARGTMDGSLLVDGSKDVPHLKSDLVLKKISLKEFFNNPKFEDVTSGRFGGRVQLTGNGKSLADVLASSDGRVTFAMSGGKISLLIIEAAGLDVAEAAPLLLDRDRSTHIRCAVGDFKVTNGILNSETFVFDTNDTNVAGDAQINLKTEALDIRVKAHPKDPSLFAAKTPIVVGGTLKNPAVGLSPGELGGRSVAAVALGALLTPVAAIIPFLEMGLGEDSDCSGLIRQAQAKSGAPVPENAPEKIAPAAE